MNQIFLLFILIYFFKPNENLRKIRWDVTDSNIENLDIQYTTKKVNIFKKIGSYFPEEIIPILNKALLITEKIIKLYEVMEFITKDDLFQPVTSTKVDNNRERFNYIISTLKKEIPEDELNRMGYPVNLIVNYDKYKYMMNIMSFMASNPQKLNNPDELTKLVESFIDGKDEKEKKQMKEMLKMIEIMKVLEPTNKQKKDPEIN